MRTGLLFAACLAEPALAEDWPEFRGKGRTGVWTESGILEAFPEKGPSIAWHTPLHGGYAGPEFLYLD